MQRRRPAQSGSCQEGALRIDFERRNPCTAAPPGDGEPSSEGCLSGAAFALCDLYDQTHHAAAA